jgi:cytochrome c556
MSQYTSAPRSVSLLTLREEDGDHMTRVRFGLAAMALLTAGAVLGSNASFGEALPSGQDLVKERINKLKQAGGAMQFLGKYDGSDAAKAAEAAKVLDDTAAGLAVWFPEGSGPGGAGIEETRAKAEIWSDRAGFDAKIKSYDDAVGVLTTAVSTNDPAQIQTALAGVGASCKACHEAYRTPED